MNNQKLSILIISAFAILGLVLIIVFTSKDKNSESTSTADSATQTYNVQGTVEGLSGTLVLVNNKGEEISVAVDEDALFEFLSEFVDGEEYEITIKNQPEGQICTIVNGTGTAGDKAKISIVCTPVEAEDTDDNDDQSEDTAESNSTTTYTSGSSSTTTTIVTHTVGGTISGLNGSLVLKNNGGDALTLTANGTFNFNTRIAEGSDYAITVASNPTNPKQTCVITNGSGTVGTSKVSNIAVVCTTETYTIGGTVSGLEEGDTLELQNNTSDDLSLTADGTFTFDTEIEDSSTYAVTVLTQPTGKVCAVSDGTGTATANVTNISVVCTTATYTIGGTVEGLLSETSVVLQNNSGDDLTVSANGSFVFATPIDYNNTYAVTVDTYPAGETCTITNGSGTAISNVTNITVECSEPQELRIFYSAGDYQTAGNLGGISGADTACASDANNPNDGATFKALLVGSSRRACTSANCTTGGASENLDWVLQPNTIYTRVDGTTPLFTTNSSGIFVFGTMSNTWGTMNYIWTGLNGDWTTHSYTCNSWTSSIGYETGQIAHPFYIDTRGISSSYNWCSEGGQVMNILCVEQPAE